MYQAPWTLDEGVTLARGLGEGSKKFGYHVALGGSVLHSGKSKKDVDLYFLSLESPEGTQTDALVSWLTELWGPGEDIGDYSRSEMLDPPTSATGRGLSPGHFVGRVPQPAETPVAPPEPVYRTRASRFHEREARRQSVRDVRELNEALLTTSFNEASAPDEAPLSSIRAVPATQWQTFTEVNPLLNPTPTMTEPTSTQYRKKLKFHRDDGRIDVFII